MFISVVVLAKILSVLNLSIFANSCKESEKAKETLLIKKFKQRKTEHLIDGGKDTRILG